MSAKFHSVVSAALLRGDVAHLRSGQHTRTDRAIGTRERWQLYHKELPMAEIAYPAEALKVKGVAEWVAKQRWAVEAHTSGGLGIAIQAGVAPARITMCCDTLTESEVRCVVGLNVGRLGVSSAEQIDVVASCSDARRPQNLLLRMTRGEMGLPLAGSAADAAIDAALGDVGLRLIGLESCVDATAAYAEVVDQLIGQMEHVRRSHGVVLDYLGLTAFEDFGAQAVLSEVATTIDDALDDACARFRFPRPLVVFSPRWDLVDCAVD